MNLENLMQMFLEDIRAQLIEVIYCHYEYGCDTSLSDEDMLKLQIDWAIENNDKERFMMLSKHLKELSV